MDNEIQGIVFEFLEGNNHVNIIVSFFSASVCNTTEMVYTNLAQWCLVVYKNYNHRDLLFTI